MVFAGASGDLDLLWGQGAIRAFLSHKAEFKLEAANIKEHLAANGIACFVAHEDIEAMKEWETEIESALFSMDVLVALLTDGFHDSNWTDQEVGVAIGRKIPVVPVRLGKDPYGFIGKFQAISGPVDRPTEIAEKIVQTIFGNNSINSHKIELARSSLADNYIRKLADSGSFAQSNSLAKELERIARLSPAQEEALVSAFNENGQVWCAWGFREEIVPQLKRLTGKDYFLAEDYGPGATHLRRSGP